MSTTITPPRRLSPGERRTVRAEIKKLEGWLEVPSVLASSHWTNDIHAKLDALREQLGGVN